MSTAVEDAFVLSLCGDDVLLLSGSAEESRHPFDAHVVALGGTACEDDLFGIGTDEVGDMVSRLLGGFLCFPAICVCSRVGITI